MAVYVEPTLEECLALALVNCRDSAMDPDWVCAELGALVALVRARFQPWDELAREAERIRAVVLEDYGISPAALDAAIVAESTQARLAETAVAVREQAGPGYWLASDGSIALHSC